MRLILDASVVIKWLLRDPVREHDTEVATRIMDDACCGQHDLLQPPHWLSEVAAVMCRLSPATAVEDVQLLGAMSLPVESNEEVFRKACELSTTLKHHLFDTLYHAVALEMDGILVTADEAYWQKAQALPSVKLLRDF